MGFTNEQRTPTGITKAKPIQVTSPNHGLENGQRVRATQFITMPFARATGMQELNNRLFVVKNCTTHTFDLYDIYGQPIDGANYTTYISGGQFTLTGPNLRIQNTI